MVSAEPDLIAARTGCGSACARTRRIDRGLRLAAGHAEAAPAAVRAHGGASLDLAYPEGRALVDRVADRGLLWIVFMQAGSGEVVASSTSTSTMPSASSATPSPGSRAPAAS